MSTIDFLAVPGRTVIVVMVELRAEDVIREFLELWLRAGVGNTVDEENQGLVQNGGGSRDIEGNGKWEIWHANTDELLDGPYAVWVGWKKPPDKTP